MVYTQHYCAKCGSEQIRRNGSKKGQPKYQCPACRYQGLFVPAAVRKASQYAQVDALLVERNPQRSIARATVVGYRTGQSPSCGLDRRQPRGSPPTALVGGAAAPLPSPLRVFHRPLESLCEGASPLAAPAGVQGRRPNQHRGSYQLFTSPALWRARA